LSEHDATTGPTVTMSSERIEAYLRQRLAQPASDRIVPRLDAGSTAPVSFAQEQLWLHAHLEPDVPVYSEPVTIHCPGCLDVGALEMSLAEILRRHAAWRTTFSVVDGAVQQTIHAPGPVVLPVVDLRSLPAPAREDEAIRLATEEARHPFDLERGPLVRAMLVRLADDEHRLFLTLHHIVFDGFALYRVFLPELATLYEAFAGGRPSPLADPPIQYADFARWQRETQQGTETWTRQLAYWREGLYGAPPLELPIDRPRPANYSFRGAMARLALSRTSTAALKALGARERASLYMTMLAVFTVLLHRYSGQVDLVVGAVTAGRKRPEVESLLGCFTNLLTLRLNCAADPTFLELLARVREIVLDALANDDVPFELVVNAVEPQRDRSRNPLFQVMFSLEPPLPPLPAGWKLTPFDVETATAKFDLHLELEDRPEGMIGRFVYCTDLFEQETIDWMVRCFHAVVDGVVADPRQRLSALSQVDATERRQLLDWSVASAPYPDRATIHEAFEDAVGRTPDVVALICGDEHLTYGALDRRADRLADRLLELGVGQDVPVGVCVERSLDLVVALLATLKAGGAYVPLDPGYPSERLSFMLSDTGTTIVLTHTSLHDRLGLPAQHTVLLDTPPGSTRSEPPPKRKPGVGPDDLAYVMFTSGSTGRPKGVAVPHRAVLRLVFGQSYARLDATRTLLFASPISFDASTLELWGALLHGGRCVLSPWTVPTPTVLGEQIRRHRVTTVWLTASLFNTVIDEAPATLAGVDEVLTGGEALSPAHVRRAYEQLPGITIVNGYGPTECTTFACCYRIPGAPDPTARTVPIGRPIANTEAYVLDPQRRLAPIGTVGELYLGGPGLARGYLNHPELTAERFVPHPFDPSPGARLYRTGDLVRWRANGVLDFMGRTDHQVKIRGFRIEPGEIEAMLASHPAVREAVVLSRERAPGERELVACVVPRAEAPDVDVLRAFLEERVPAFMIPGRFVALPALPLTPTGKIDRQALTAHVSSATAPASVARRLSARDPLEAQLAALWEDVLDVHPVGMRDDFFALGGHSLGAVRIVQQIERLFGLRLPLSAIHANTTVETLARALIRRQQHTFAVPMLKLQADGTRRPFFFFHGDLNGGGFYCRELARHLGPDQPLFAIHPLGLDGRPVPATIEAMAAEHLTQIRAIQPHGPYFVGGYCNGGLTAYEVARALAAAGERVEPIVLIGAAADTRFGRLRALLDQVAGRLGMREDEATAHFGRLRYLVTRFAASRTSGRVRLLLETAVTLLDGTLRRLGVAGRAPRTWVPVPGSADGLVSEQTYARYYTAVMAYVPRAFPGRALAFWPAEESGRRAGDPTLGWSPLVEHVEVIHVPGDHQTIVTRHAELIASAIQARRDAKPDTPLREIRTEDPVGPAEGELAVFKPSA
jgi:amino acid adenylation domain-containing protein